MPRGASGGTAVAPTRWPLVGRWQELDLLADALDGPDARGALIYGPAGVGKTRLADECLEQALQSGRVGGRAAASAATSGLSLSALVPLLPVEVVGTEFDPTTLYATVARAFREQAGDRPYVLVVDDMHRLDATSATLLGQLLDANVIFLIGTVRVGESASHVIGELWRRDHVLRVDLEDLAPSDIDTLLHLALGGPVNGATVETIRTLSRGNVLFVRELVLGARVAGRLEEHQGVWQLTGPAATTARLAELVDARLGAAPDEAHPVLMLLALMEPIGLSDLEALAGLDILEELDAAGLLDIRTDGRRQQVTLAHPLYAEVMRERISPLARRRILHSHVERIEGHGARRREDAVHIANARLDADGSADPALLTTAARLARYGHDYPQVERLARAALIEAPRPEALLMLAEALHELGAYEEAEAELVAREALLTDAEDRVRLSLVEMRVRNLFWGLQRLDDALAVNRAAQAASSNPDSREELVIDEAMALAMTGRPLEALEVVQNIELSTPRARVLRSVAEVPALTLTGRCDTAIELARRAYRDHEALGDQMAVAHPGIHSIHEMNALLDAGRFATATKLASIAYPIAIGINAPAGLVWWTYGLGRAAYFMGRLETAKRWLGEAAGLTRDGFYGQRRIVLSMLATVEATLGNAAAAQAAADELDALPPFAYRAPEQSLGRAWAAAARDELETARAILVAAAQDAAATGQAAQEAWLLHDVARLGDPGAARERLDELAVTCEGKLAGAYAAHARSAAARSAPGLTDAVEQFAALGAVLLAAEAATEAADAYRRDGDRRAATAMLGRASTLASQCDGARTPALVTIADAPEPLTQREREIATLAAQRLASKEIAQRLQLSVRTVDNHLQRIYTKLGIGGRADLPDALDYVDDV